MRLKVFCSIAVLALFCTRYVRAQDTLSQEMPCYAEILADWQEQDGTAQKGYRTVIANMLPVLPHAARTLVQNRLDNLSGVADDSPQMLQLYVRACSARRSARMAPYIDKFKNIVFASHARFSNQTFDMYQYVSFPVWPDDGSHSHHTLILDYPAVQTGNGRISYLTQLQMNGMYGTMTRLLSANRDGPRGLIRDVDVSWDGKKILFAWKKSFDPNWAAPLWRISLL